VPGVIERVTIGDRKRVYPCHGLQDRISPDRYSVYIRTDGEIVKAKAFTKKRR